MNASCKLVRKWHLRTLLPTCNFTTGTLKLKDLFWSNLVGMYHPAVSLVTATSPPQHRAWPWGDPLRPWGKWDCRITEGHKMQRIHHTTSINYFSCCLTQTTMQSLFTWYHHSIQLRKLFHAAYAPKPLSFAVRRSEQHSPEGIMAVEETLDSMQSPATWQKGETWVTIHLLQDITKQLDWLHAVKCGDYIEICWAVVELKIILDSRYHVMYDISQACSIQMRMFTSKVNSNDQ